MVGFTFIGAEFRHSGHVDISLTARRLQWQLSGLGLPDIVVMLVAAFRPFIVSLHAASRIGSAEIEVQARTSRDIACRLIRLNVIKGRWRP